MNTLKELVALIEQHKLKPRGLSNFQDAKYKKSLNQCYQMIANGEIDTDEAAAQYFFNAPPSNILYRKFKTRLKTYLLNKIFFIEIKQSNYSDYDEAYLTCSKEWAATKIIFNRRAAYSGVEFARRILKKTQYYEFTELSLNICRVMRSYYATRFPDLIKFEHYNQLMKRYSEQFMIESRAEELYFLLVRHFIESKAGRPEVAIQAEKFCSELEPYLQTVPSYRLHRSYFQIKVASYMCKSDYQNTLFYCDQALQVIEAKAFFTPTMSDFFHLQKISCHIQLRQYEEGRNIADKHLLHEEPGSFNWFKNRYLLIRLAIHTGNYQEGYTIYQQVIRQPSFKQLDPTNFETWKIYEAYLKYLALMRYISISIEGMRPNFRLAKFLNQVPIYSKDKQGMNIPILVVQILFMLAQRRYDTALNRLEAIEKYRSRYLTQNETYRSNIFIRMLLSIPLAGFNQIAVKRRAKRWHEMLVESAQQDTNYDIEIIPYEVLWEIVLESLDSKVHIYDVKVSGEKL